MHISSKVIDDLSRNPPLATIGTQWQVVTDQVMGGMSSDTLVREIVGDRPAIHMRGCALFENNGGFVQIGLDLAHALQHQTATLSARLQATSASYHNTKTNPSRRMDRLYQSLERVTSPLTQVRGSKQFKIADLKHAVRRPHTPGSEFLSDMMKVPT